MSDITDSLEGLSPEKRELLALLLKEEQPTQGNRIQPLKREINQFPLSFSQQRLWFLDRLDPGSPLYNLPMAVRIKGSLSLNALTSSITTVIHRHESLRTVFSEVDGKPIQIILETIPISIIEHDLRNEFDDDKETKANSLAEILVAEPFDLKTAPLMRIHLIHLEELDHIVLIVMHHIISDGWSLGILVEEIIGFYEISLTGEEPTISPLPIQYPDFAVWQHEWLNGKNFHDQLGYWKDKLLDCPNILEMPVDFPRSTSQLNKGGKFTFYLSLEATSGLREFIKAENVTMYMVLLTTFYLLLYRYSGQNDINLGTPIANRSRVELEKMIGFLVNTLVLRVDLSGNPSFRMLLKRVQETTIGAFDHADLPFEMLVDHLQPERDMSFTPLFQMMFVYQNTPRITRKISGTTMEVFQVHSGTSKYDLTLVMGEGPRRLIGSIEYDLDLFKPSTIERFSEHFNALIEAILKDPDSLINSLPILNTVERHLILEDYNNNKLLVPVNETIVSLFEHQAQLNPERTAVISESDSVQNRLSFQELNQRANQLARMLIKAGVNQNDLVGLFIERSVEMLIGLMGILKAGCAYVPLDPLYPQDRLNTILQDITDSKGLPPIVVSQTGLINKLPGKQSKVIFIDSTELDGLPNGNLHIPIFPSDLCYVLYTSGSTGKPKGVMIEHANAINLWVGLRKEIYGGLQGHGWVCSLNAPLLFDASVQQWLMLLSGETIIVVPQEVRLDGKRLLEWLGEHQVNILDCVPSQLKMLQSAGFFEAEGLMIKAVLPGGEAIDTSLWQAMVGHPRIEFFNMYGPTECTVDSTISRVKKYPNKPNIGRGYVNTNLYVFDGNNELVPIGVPGELYISGNLVGRGYFNNPLLTEKNFLMDPFRPTERMYRTGDRVRWLDEGVLEFLGRIDNQVKIRGFRIELGEIETSIKQHPAIKEVVVVDKEIKINNSEDKRLFAYLVTEENTRGEKWDGLIRELRNYLKNHIPDYMIPSSFIYLENLPLTPNGKVDRKKLPEPEAIKYELSEGGSTPRTQDEEILANIWAILLGQEQVSIHDNFFELGGHSLLITQLLSRVRTSFDIDISVRSFFENPTIAGLAALIFDMRQSHQGIGTRPALVARTDLQPVLSFSQQRLWFLEQLNPGTPSYNIPSAVRINGVLDFSKFEKSLIAVIRRHDILRTSFHTISGKAQIHIEENTKFKLPIIDLTTLSNEERERQVIILSAQEAQKPFDLAQSPLLRVQLLKLKDDECLVLWTFHHIISDGWSSKVFMEDLVKYYVSTKENHGPDLSPLKVQYQDYSTWQREWLTGEVLQQELDYWKGALSDSTALLDLPTDYPRPASPSGKGDFITFNIPEDLSNRIQKITKTEGVTLFMFFLASFSVLLSRYSRQKDISIGTPVANRGMIEIEKLIGFFVNTLVLRIPLERLTENPTFRSLLHLVRQVSLEAFNHTEIPFEMVVDAVQPERNLSHSPLFQAMLTIQNLDDSRQSQQTSDLIIKPVEMHLGTSKFDLTMSIEKNQQSLTGALEYNSDLFEIDTIHRLIQNFLTLLDGIVNDTIRNIWQLPIIHPSECRVLLEEWSSYSADTDHDACIHARFEKWAAVQPEHPAVYHEGSTLTYQELNKKANQLARYLRSAGIGPDSLVGILTERSVETIIAMLAVLKAGGAYIPIDPNYPQERIIYMLEDAGSSQPLGKLLLLTQERLISKNSIDPASCFCLDKDWHLASNLPGDNLELITSADNLAYVIYTSGSTGKPKGTLLAHRGLCNLCEFSRNLYNITPQDRNLQFFSMGFDGSVWDIFMSLSNGGTLYLARHDTSNIGLEILQYMRQNRITIVVLPPSLLAVLPAEELPDLRIINVGGEACSKEIIEKWGRNRLFFNAYGPTESTIVSNISRCYPGDPLLPGIGRAIANLRQYIVDENMQLTPIGVPGELLLGGIGLAKGYLNQPQLTSERFIPDPFLHGEIVYRTGDLVRIRKDGNVEFLGRVDFQVKIRGFRIELGEIESLIRQQPGVKETCVWVKSENNVKRLIAFIAPEDISNPPDTNEILRAIKQELPEYMLPSAILILDALPRTLNLKIDYKKLSSIPLEVPSREEDYQEPSNDKQILLTKIWREVLRLEQIGLRDNFFELGGDSILSIQVVSQARQAGLKLTPRQIFEHQTIEELAYVIEYDSTNLITAEQGIVSGEVPLTPIQRWFFDQNFSEPGYFNQAMLLEVKGRLDPGHLEIAFNALINHHDALRMKFIQDEHKEWQEVNLESLSEPIFSVVDLSKLSESEWPDNIKKISGMVQANLDLKSGRLIKVVYFDLGEGNSARLLIVIHHLVVDGVSWRLLFEDLWTGYLQSQSGVEKILLPKKTTSFREWALRLKEYTDRLNIESVVQPWIELLNKSTGQIPLDDPYGNNACKDQVKATMNLSEDETKNLFKEANQTLSTEIDELLLSAFVIACQKTFGIDSILIELEGHGRQEITGMIQQDQPNIDLSRSVGWFTIVYPVRLVASGWMTPLEVLKTNRQTLNKVPEGGFTYSLLRYGVNDIQSKLRILPQAEIVFNYLGQIDRGLITNLPFKFAQEEIGPSQSQNNQRAFPLEINGGVSGGCLGMDIVYSQEQFRSETIQTLVNHFRNTLLDYCNTKSIQAETSFIPSDFKLSGLDQVGLDKLVGKIKKKK